MSETSQRRELEAVFHFLSIVDTAHREIASVSDLWDGAVLFDILSQVDENYFRRPASLTRQPAPGSDNWVIRFNALKRLYRLMNQYTADVLQKPTSGLEIPDLQAIAQDQNVNHTLILCRLAIVIGVQCERNAEFIAKIQSLSEVDQHHIMKAIERVMANITSAGPSKDGSEVMTEDDHYYRIQSEKSALLTEKEVLEKVYQSLLEEHRTLQTNYDDVLSEKDDAVARLREANHEAATARNDKSDAVLRGEIERLRSELQKSEDNLAMAEGELDKQTSVVTDLTRKVDELQSRADEAAKLKDKLDEYRHVADKLQKSENVMEKYKKKLQEGADLRQQVRSLEKQNADLVDKNASLEEEYRKVAAFKPLMESYKNQIADLETKGSTRAQEIDKLKFELEESRTKLRVTMDERAKDSETLELYQERVRELELSSAKPISQSKITSPIVRQSTDDEFTIAELTPSTPQEHDADDDLDHSHHGLGSELDDAVSGTTMTDLKIQIRKLQRELEGVRKNEADASRILVLENLLEDANRMKTRYESDYLAAHREKLVLQRDLEEIRSGKSMGDGAEAAIALRQRLNESVDQLDALRKEHAELEVKFDTVSKELTIAKSDLTLVNKDQLDILSTLRESVNEDKAGLEADVERLMKQNKELQEKNRMQLEQVNSLLLEKVNMQSEGIGHREMMLQRERAIGDLRASLSGKDIPEDIKSRLLALHEENVNLKEGLKTEKGKLQSARQFIKSQDKLFKEQLAAGGGPPSEHFEEAKRSYETTIKDLTEQNQRAKRRLNDLMKGYRKEQILALGAMHELGMKVARYQLGASPSQSTPRPDSWAWMGKTREKASHSLIQRVVQKR